MLFRSKPRSKEISIHAPREGSDDVNPGWVIIEGPISIHAPRKRSDMASRMSTSAWLNFYPRSPQGERRDHPSAAVHAGIISIHAPREGSDRNHSFQIRQ